MQEQGSNDLMAYEAIARLGHHHDFSFFRDLIDKRRAEAVNYIASENSDIEVRRLQGVIATYNYLLETIDEAKNIAEKIRTNQKNSGGRL